MTLLGYVPRYLGTCRSMALVALSGEISDHEAQTRPIMK